MIALLTLLCILIPVCVFMGVRSHQRERILEVDARLGIQPADAKKKRRPSLKGLQTPFFARTKRRLGITSTLSSIGTAVIFSIFTKASPAIGFLIGALLPNLILTAVRSFYLYRYEADAKLALMAASGVFSSGGTFDEWMLESHRMTTGPLSAAFATGYQNLRLNVPVADFLAALADNCPIPFYEEKWRSMLAISKTAGDMVALISRAQDDIVEREKFGRNMEKLRGSALGAAGIVIIVPTELYLMFHEKVKLAMTLHWITIPIFVLGTAGIFGLVYLIFRITKTSMD